MPLIKSKSPAAFKRNVSTLMGEVGKSPHVKSKAQALAISYSIKRRGKADGGAIERLPDHYAEIGAARIEDRRNHDPTLRAMGIDKLKKRFGMKHSDAMMDSQRTEAEVVDRLVPRGHADGGAVLAPGFYAQGGSPYPQMWQPMAGGGTPWETKAEARQLVPHSGFIPGIGGGRSDRVPMGVKRSSYVLPADIVSAVGDGNSQAGAAKLASKFGAPYGAPMPKIKGTPLKTTRIIRQKFADGGMDGDPAPVADIVASSGEYVIDPSVVEKLGGGSIEHGHNILDAFVSHIRKKTIKTLKKLPKPKKR